MQSLTARKQKQIDTSALDVITGEIVSMDEYLRRIMEKEFRIAQDRRSSVTFSVTDKNQNLILDLLGSLSKEDYDNDFVGPSIENLKVVENLLLDANSDMKFSMPIPTSAAPDGEGGLAITWLNNNKTLRLVHSERLNYLFSDNGEGSEVNENFSLSTLRSKLNWLMI